jgi:hypothetical protein
MGRCEIPSCEGSSDIPVCTVFCRFSILKFLQMSKENMKLIPITYRLQMPVTNYQSD